MTIKLQIGCAFLAASSFTAQGQQPATTVQETPSAPQSTSTPAPSANAPAPSPDQQSTNPSTDTPVAPGISKPPVQSAGKSAGVDSAHYIIGAEDALQITVWREPNFSGSFPVRPDGMISINLVGDVPAAGLTPTQLGADIEQRLHKFVQDPSVTVQVMSVNSQKIYLIGEVGHVGAVALAPGMSPLQAIAAGGGLSPFANPKHIYILRGTGPSQQKIPFNYKQALKGDVRQQQIALHPGDTIVVP